MLETAVEKALGTWKIRHWDREWVLARQGDEAPGITAITFDDDGVRLDKSEHHTQQLPDIKEQRWVRLISLLNLVHHNLPDLRGTIYACLDEQVDLPNMGFPVFTFAKSPRTPGIPIIDHLSASNGWIQGWVNKTKDAEPWINKTSRCQFSFGNWGVPRRLDVARLSLLHPELLEVKIWNRGPKLNQKYQNFCGELPPKDFFCHFVTPAEQLRNKYLLSVMSWDATHWKLASNSLLINLEEPELTYQTWREMFMEPGKHYLATSLEALPEAIEWAQTHDAEAEKMALAGSNLSKTFLNFDGAVSYTTELLQAYFDLEASKG